MLKRWAEENWQTFAFSSSARHALFGRSMQMYEGGKWRLTLLSLAADHSHESQARYNSHTSDIEPVGQTCRDHPVGDLDIEQVDQVSIKDSRLPKS